MNEFSVYWWDKSGVRHEDLKSVNEEEAIERAGSLVYGPNARLDIIKKIVVTDETGRLVFHEDYSKQKRRYSRSKEPTMYGPIKHWICVLFHRHYWEAEWITGHCIKCNRRWKLTP